MNTKKVVEVHCTVLFTCTPDTGVASAARMTATEKVRHVLVLDHGVLVGVISHRDLARAAPHKQVEEFMHKPVLCIAPDTTVDEALEIMEAQGVGFLPIIEGAHLIGYVDDHGLRGTERPAPLSAHVANPN